MVPRLYVNILNETSKVFTKEDSPVMLGLKKMLFFKTTGDLTA